MNTAIELVWAQAHDGVIGRDGGMPWHIPEDLAHFKRVTLGAPVIMGRRTWESLPERFRPLPGRQNLVVSRNSEFSARGATVYASVTDALAAVSGESRVCVIGGGQMYREALPRATALEVTQIELDVPDADTFAPRIDDTWHLISETEPQISASGPTYRFQRYIRQIA